MNTYGNKFRITVFGESHGPAIGVVIDGARSGIPLSEDDLIADLDRRKPVRTGTTPRKETDRPEILSGVYNGYTTGGAVTVIFRNDDTRGADYTGFTDHPRPSHVDRVAQVKYGGFADPRGSGHFSGRLTLALVAAGTIARKILGQGVVISSKITEIGGCNDASRFDTVVGEAQAAGDSVGAIIECTVTGLAAGIGEPFFDSVESRLAQVLFSVPGVKGVEFGAGFRAARMRGSDFNDCFIDGDGHTLTNNSGGINGGITNGNPLVFRVAVRPPASISKPQQTYDFAAGSVRELTFRGRHDACFALRLPVVVESAAAIVLADFIL